MGQLVELPAVVEVGVQVELLVALLGAGLEVLLVELLEVVEEVLLVEVLLEAGVEEVLVEELELARVLGPELVQVLEVEVVPLQLGRGWLVELR